MRDGNELRARLADARLLLLFTPAIVPADRDPLEVLDAALPWVDAVQVRIKPAGAASQPAHARESQDWALAVLERVAQAHQQALVFVNDRVDVALALRGEGIAGVHLGQDDLAPRSARELLGPEPLIGLSTHNGRQVARACDEPVDYLGFGPVWASDTKGYEHGLGPEAAWVAASSSRPRPVFAIGGIDATNAAELSAVGRAAVASAVLAADDPGAAARAIRRSLEKAA